MLPISPFLPFPFIAAGFSDVLTYMSVTHFIGGKYIYTSVPGGGSPPSTGSRRNVPMAGIPGKPVGSSSNADDSSARVVTEKTGMPNSGANSGLPGMTSYVGSAVLFVIFNP